MIYFSKGWQKGDPGGTFMSLEEDESTIIFEPYNLDNSVALFLDGQILHMDLGTLRRM